MNVLLAAIRRASPTMVSALTPATVDATIAVPGILRPSGRILAGAQLIAARRDGNLP
jgi:hypothetical protein